MQADLFNGPDSQRDITNETEQAADECLFAWLGRGGMGCPRFANDGRGHGAPVSPTTGETEDTMGATSFEHTVISNDPGASFQRLIESARYMYGNDPYSGTIAGKDKVVGLDRLIYKNQAEARGRVGRFLEDDEAFDKWGPAYFVRYRATPAEKKAAGLARKRDVYGYIVFGWAAD